MKLSTLATVLALSTATCLSACAMDDSKADVSQDAVASVDINGAKDDSLTQPTVQGAIAMDDTVDGALTRRIAFNAYDFTYTGDAGQVRLDVVGERRTDAAVIAYRKAGNRWTLVDWNDDCDRNTRDACLTVAATSGSYRFIVTTYEALVGRPGAATYLFGVSCAGGGCEAPAEVTCGGRGGHACADGQFCSFPVEMACGSFDGPGVCTTIATICPALYKPVCGCDGQTYGNACYAAREGASVAADGACEESEPVACGGRAGNTCGDDEFCEFERGAICGQADAQGVCTPRETGACPVNIQAVCGCDGNTYATGCDAGKAGTGVLHDGRCTTPAE